MCREADNVQSKSKLRSAAGPSRGLPLQGLANCEAKSSREVCWSVPVGVCVCGCIYVCRYVCTYVRCLYVCVLSGR